MWLYDYALDRLIETGKRVTVANKFLNYARIIHRTGSHTFAKPFDALRVTSFAKGLHIVHQYGGRLYFRA